MISKFTIDGGAELAKALRALPDKIENQALREAVSEAVEPIRSRASELAPRDANSKHPVHLADTIETAVRKVRKGVSAKVGPTADGMPRGIFQEFGTATQPGQPYLRPALDEQAEGAISTVAGVLRDFVEGQGV